MLGLHGDLIRILIRDRLFRRTVSECTIFDAVGHDGGIYFRFFIAILTGIWTEVASSPSAQISACDDITAHMSFHLGIDAKIVNACSHHLG